MTTKDHNLLKNVYLQSFIFQDDIERAIDTFDYKTFNNTELKKEIILLLHGKPLYDDKWDRLLNPNYFSKDLETVLERLKAKRSAKLF